MMGLRGYVSAMAQDGRVRLYQRLDDLSEGVEIPSSAIVHMARATDSVPPGAMIFWIKEGAEITHFFGGGLVRLRNR